MIIDKTVHEWLLNGMYEETHIKHYGQYPLGIRFHLGIIDNHKEIKKAHESDNEFYTDKLVGIKTATKELKEVRKTGAYLYQNNEAYDYENCTPTRMKSLTNDHWEYLRTNTWWSENALKVLGFKLQTYIPEEGCSYVLFWNWVYQEFLMKHRVKTKRPTSTINSDDTVINLKIPHGEYERDVFVVTSTEDKYRNHTESLKDAKIFVEPGESVLKILYK